MNETIKLLNERISLRKYADQPVTESELNMILNGAMRAPTAGNLMLYSVIVVKSTETKTLLSKTCDNQPFIANAPVVLIFLADMRKTLDLFKYSDVKGFVKSKGEVYREQKKANLFLAAGDAFIAAQNAAIAAESLGIGTCYIGDIVENYKIHREHLDLPDKVFPIAMLCLGHYPEDIPRTPKYRFDQKYVVFNEKYKELDQEEIFDMYGHYIKMFNSRNAGHVDNLGQNIYVKKFGSEFMEEMERSIDQILESWNVDE